MSSARGFTDVNADPTPPANSRSAFAATYSATETPAPIPTALPTATPWESSSASPSASWVTPSATIFERSVWYCHAASPAPRGSAIGALRVQDRSPPPTPSSSMSLVTMMAPAIPPTATRQLNVRPHARAIGSSLRCARKRCAATPIPIAATSPARITPRWVIRRCEVSGPRPATLRATASINDCDDAVSP